MIEEYMKIFITILIDILCIYIAYFYNSKFARKELNIPIQFGIMLALIFIVLGSLTTYALIHESSFIEINIS